MHPTEPKTAFLFMRGNGWSLGRISKQLGIPRTTLFNWDREQRKTIYAIKCLQVEKLQEKYIPSFEEELQHMSSSLTRIERALDKHDYEKMRPEALLYASMQLRARLHRFRSDLPFHPPLEQIGLQPLAVGGCISRSQNEIPDPDDHVVPSSASQPETLNSQPSSLDLENGTNWNKNGGGSKMEHSHPVTSDEANGTVVPFSEPAPEPAAEQTDISPSPAVNLQPSTLNPLGPRTREEFSLTATTAQPLTRAATAAAIARQIAALARKQNAAEPLGNGSKGSPPK